MKLSMEPILLILVTLCYRVNQFQPPPVWEALDCDGDGVSNGQEIIDGTDPLDTCDLVVANQDTTRLPESGMPWTVTVTE